MPDPVTESARDQQAESLARTPAVWTRLLTTALRSPSPHNVQPWRVRVIDESQAELFIEKRRTLPDEDVEGSFIILTMGMFCESLDLAAAHESLRLEVAPLAALTSFTAACVRAASAEVIPFARLTLHAAPGRIAEVPLALFERRRTSRLAYRTTAVEAPVQDALGALAASAGHRLLLETSSDRIERLLALNTEAVLEDLNHAPYRNEMRGWLRYSESASRRYRDGLDARCMNAAPAELWFVFHAPGMLRWPGISHWFKARYREQIGPVTTLGMLDGPFWAPAEAFPTGRFLTRFWLECARHGLSLHPYGNLVTNRPVASRVGQEMNASRIWLVFKFGVSEPAPASRRRSLAEVLLA